MSLGTYTIKASFAGTDTYLPSTGSVNLIATAIATTLTLSTPSSLTQGSSTDLTSTLTDSQGNLIQYQIIEFLINGMSIGSATTDTLGEAKLTYTPNTSGSVQIQALYQGAGNYAQSSSPVVTVQISTPGLGTTGTIILVVTIFVLTTIILYVVIRRRKPKPAQPQKLTNFRFRAIILSSEPLRGDNKDSHNYQLRYTLRCVYRV